MEEKLNTSERASKLDISALSSGTYFVLLRFSTGESTVLPLVIRR